MSWNRYSYVQMDPVNYNDPSGLARCSVISEDSRGVAEVQCISPLGRMSRMEMSYSGPMGSEQARQELARSAERTWGAEQDREEADDELSPYIARALELLRNRPGCADLYSGTNLSAADVLGFAGTRWSLTFGKVTSIVPTAAQTKEVDWFPSISITPLGTYYQKVATKFDVDMWTIFTDQERLLTVMHELGHAVELLGVGNITGGFVHQDRRPEVNQANDDLIKVRCLN